MSYVTVSYSNPFSNPYTKTVDRFDELKASIDNFVIGVNKLLYWINPLNLFKEANKALYWLVHQPEVGHYFVAATIVGIWFLMLGANFPKKYLFWGWIGFWFLKAVVYNF